MEKSGKQTDVRVITLKRWNLPQSRSLHQIWQENGSAEPYGDYISFQSYHFIDVSPVDTSSERGIFPAAYEVVTRARQGNEGDKSKDIYIQQSMVVYGEANGFWVDKPEVLYLTMIQLTNRPDLDMPKLQADIRALFQTRGVPEDRWALYYSLDFCDLILFVRDIPMSAAQDILWSLAPVRSGAMEQIRDTVTVYGLDFSRVMESFDRYADGGAPEWGHPEEEVTLSLSLGVQKLNAWTSLKREVERLPGVRSTCFRALGRYDVQLVLEHVSFFQMLQVLWWIDHACGREHNNAFGCYEVVPLAPWQDLGVRGQSDRVDHEFLTVADRTLERLFQIYTDVLKEAGEPTRGYAAEIRRALIALLSNGFSEEFVLSVFHSFTEYLHFVAEMMGDKSREDDMESRWMKRKELYDFQHSYLQALNMLAHCTMHNERQFIQAPAFNAAIFDVPPKLLAFYAGVAYKVTELLNDENRTYSFLFSPDFRPDIYIRPISGEGYSSKLLVFYINERMFYDPVVVIQTMCHEIAHHVGKKARRRKERAQLILECIGGYLIYMTLPIRDGELAQAMAKVIQQEVMKEYERWFDPVSEKGRQYYLTSITNFLKSQNHLYNLIESDDFLYRLRLSWAEAMGRYDITELVKMLDRTMYSGYLQRMYTNQKTRGAALNQLAGEMTMRMRAELRKWKSMQPSGGKADAETGRMPKFVYYRFCECIPQVFSEAYADLRMLDILEIHRWEDYLNLLVTNLELAGDFRERWEYQEYLRCAAILSLLGADEEAIPWWGEEILDGPNYTDRLVLDFCLDRLLQYLILCQQPGYGPSRERISRCGLRRLAERICDSDSLTVFSAIRDTALDYRQNLKRYCRMITDPT